MNIILLRFIYSHLIALQAQKECDDQSVSAEQSTQPSNLGSASTEMTANFPTPQYTTTDIIGQGGEQSR